MNFDLQKFFIGLMDFFSILLPGALLTWLRMGEVDIDQIEKLMRRYRTTSLISIILAPACR